MRMTFLAICSLAVSGCGVAEFTSINRSFNPAGGDSRLIDAKQRAIISVPGEGNRQIVCAEPSPDALQATAAALSGSAALDQPGAAEAALQAAAGVNEGVASIGLRTQSIQLLRDSYYRNCEGFASGALDDIAFNIMHQRFQNHTVALLAIEQLTGASIAPAAAAGASSSGTASSEINVSTTTNQSTEGAGGAPGASDPTEIIDASETTDGTAAGSIGGTTSFTINAPGNASPSPLPEHVSLAVASIAHDALNQDYGVQLCLEYARNAFTSEKNARFALERAVSAGGRSVGEALEDLEASKLALAYCRERLTADSRRQQAINELVEAKATIVKAVAQGIAARGSRHLSDKHALEIIEAINLTLPTDPATAFQLRGQQLSAGGLASPSQ